MSVRRAFVWASAGRYLTMAIGLLATLILARLLAPREYGVTVLGGEVFAVAEPLRALGGGAYLIQKHDLAHDDIRACFTVSLLATVLLAGVLWLLAQPLATFFAMPQLAPWAWEASFAACLIFPLAGVASDLRRGGRVHPAWLCGLAVTFGVFIGTEVITFSPVGAALYKAVAAGSKGAAVAPLAFGRPPSPRPSPQGG